MPGSSVEAMRALARRSVVIRARPRPRDVYESHQVLRYLQTFGVIQSFRNLKYDQNAMAPNVLLAVFEDEDSAARLIAQAPSTLEIPPAAPFPPLHEVVSLMESAQQSIRLEPGSGPQANTPQSDQRQTSIELTVHPSHQDYVSWIHRQEFYSHYKLFSSLKGIAFKDLEKRVPVPALAYLKASPEQVPSPVMKVIRRNLESRQTLQQLWEHGQSKQSALVSAVAGESEPTAAESAAAEATTVDNNP